MCQLAWCHCVIHCVSYLILRFRPDLDPAEDYFRLKGLSQSGKWIYSNSENWCLNPLTLIFPFIAPLYIHIMYHSTIPFNISYILYKIIKNESLVPHIVIKWALTAFPKSILLVPHSCFIAEFQTLLFSLKTEIIKIHESVIQMSCLSPSIFYPGCSRLIPQYIVTNPVHPCPYFHCA